MTESQTSRIPETPENDRVYNTQIEVPDSSVISRFIIPTTSPQIKRVKDALTSPTPGKKVRRHYSEIEMEDSQTDRPPSSQLKRYSNLDSVQDTLWWMDETSQTNSPDSYRETQSESHKPQGPGSGVQDSVWRGDELELEQCQTLQQKSPSKSLSGVNSSPAEYYDANEELIQSDNEQDAQMVDEEELEVVSSDVEPVDNELEERELEMDKLTDSQLECIPETDYSDFNEETLPPPSVIKARYYTRQTS